ncbi:hypothetical protein [Desulfovermiculus halophilus]|jgi:type IV pilus biogenesis protein CpaD/CtpE|uniref:hypothetical protein n=1 Tax=Desulfovermiculus halophilus TaxID=339722 RepID=UPI00048204BE|nr:hypothetical protein [Desulfovermiculus halophilus]
MKNNHLIIATIACIGLIAIWAAPAKAYDQKYWSEQNFGRSVESAKYKQIINHEPVENQAMEDLDGQAAMKTIQQYRKSFDKEGDVGQSGISELGM